MNRRTLALLSLAALALLAGCTGFGGGGLDEERLARNATYDWNTTADVTVTVEGGEYRAVYDVENGTAVEAFRRETLGGRSPVEVAAVQFRYPNGTVVNASGVAVEQADNRVVITPPADEGQVAYSAPASGSRFELPVTVDGSYEVVLPPGRRVSNPIFGDVNPGGYDATTDERDRVHLRWENLQDGSITVRSYLQRDLYLFAGLIGLLVLASLGGVVYFRLQIRKLEREREEAGLDVDLDQDDDSGGPPLR